MISARILKKVKDSGFESDELSTVESDGEENF